MGYLKLSRSKVPVSISGLLQLKTLVLIQLKVINLENLPNLKHLDIDAVSKVDDEIISTFKSLESLRIRDCNNIKSLKSRDNLKFLDLSGIIKIRELPVNLKELNVYYIARGFHLIKNWKELISIRKVKLYGQGIMIPTDLNPQVLYLFNCNYDQDLSNMTRLKKVVLPELRSTFIGSPIRRLIDNLKYSYCKYYNGTKYAIYIR